jgi:SAM-dependent methyltransferase
MQDVLSQIKSGALVCPRSGQMLATDAARTRLVTPDGRYQYPLLEGSVPILLVDEEAMREYVGGGAQMIREYTEAKTPPRRSLPLRILRRLVYRGGEPQVSDYRTQASVDAADKVLAGQPAGAVCLSIGGGPGRGGEFTNVNIGAFPNVDVVADAHALPYADASVHAIYCEAVIEHLYAPHQAVGEMYRVLKPGGMVFAGTPFMQPYHGYPHHYQNFTLQGQENLFRRAGFCIVDSGTCVGPVHAIVMSVAVFLAQYCTSRAERFVSRLWNFSSQYLYPLDRRINTRPNAHMLASTTYVLARKEAAEATL